MNFSKVVRKKVPLNNLSIHWVLFEDAEGNDGRLVVTVANERVGCEAKTTILFAQCVDKGVEKAPLKINLRQKHP